MRTRILAIVVLAAGCSAALLAAGSGEPTNAATGPDSAPRGEFPGTLNLPARPHVWPGPETFRIGNAVTPVNYWMTAWMFNDLVRQAGFEGEIGDVRESTMWVPSIDGEWLGNDRYLVQRDARGWPLSMELSDGRRADRLTSIIAGGSELPGTYPAGLYRLRHRGTAEIGLGGAEFRGEADGETLWFFDGNGTLFLEVSEIDPTDPPSAIQVLRPDAEPGQTFTREYIDFLRPWSVIRPLHFFGEQLSYGPRLAWEDRKPLDYSHWGGALGAPYELAAQLANESVSDLWLNLPIAASDDFVRELAALMLDELDPERKVYLELGNELWNWSDPYAYGREYALEQARRRWPGVEGEVREWSGGDPVDQVQLVYSWQGVRTLELAAVFREVWADHEERVFAVLAGQIGASQPFWHPSRHLLGCPVAVGEEGIEPCGFGVDAFAVAPYIGEAPPEIEFSRRSADAFFDEAISFVRGEDAWSRDSAEPGLRWLIESDRQLAAEYGLPLVAYEGGQHFTGSSFTRDVVGPHPRMRELYDALFESWQGAGGGLFVHFAGLIPRGQNEPGTEPSYYQSENFGIKELQTQSRAEAPRWDAVLWWMEQIGQLTR